MCPRQRCCVLSSPRSPWKQVHSSAQSPWKQVYSSSSFSCHPASVTSCSGQSVPLSTEKQTASILAGPPLDSFQPPSSPHVATAAVHQQNVARRPALSPPRLHSCVYSLPTLRAGLRPGESHSPPQGPHSPPQITQPSTGSHSPHMGSHSPYRGSHCPPGVTQPPQGHTAPTRSHSPHRGSHCPPGVTQPPWGHTATVRSHCPHGVTAFYGVTLSPRGHSLLRGHTVPKESQPSMGHTALMGSQPSMGHTALMGSQSPHGVTTFYGSHSPLESHGSHSHSLVSAPQEIFVLRS